MRMRKVTLVICEGETEESYITLLRNRYRSPVKIVSHIEGTRVTPSLVEKRTRELKISLRDKVQTFLMYDADVPAVNEKLKRCNAALLLSNPCFELWLLLHAKAQETSITTDEVLKELRGCAPVWRKYSKSSFTSTQREFLTANIDAAIERAKKLKEPLNPSTGIYKLVEMIIKST